MANDNHTIFISYARPDQETALELYEWLTKRGYSVWIDARKLKPGQNWDHEIRRALDASSFVLIILSKNSKDKRGYVQREIKIALDKLYEKLVDDIFLIPVLLDGMAEIPDQVKKSNVFQPKMQDTRK